jgi:hypothetical protein
MNDSPLIVRAQTKPTTLAQINPDHYYRPFQLKHVGEFIAFWKSPQDIYRHLKDGRIDCIHVDGTNARLIQGRDFIRFLTGE